jgi:replicative DNA helicase
VIIVDYLRKIRSENGRTDERLRVDEILSNLTDMAKNNNVPILVISELARDSYKGGQRLSMASFKESGSIEYEASWLGILAAVEESDGGYNLKRDWQSIIEHDGNIDLIVFKAKRGTGVTGKIPLKLDKANMAVRDRIEQSKTDTVNATNRKSKFD